MEAKGIVFDIKKYAIHDGPGIRTTIFLKGCPLSCWWCHNPEGITATPELRFQKNRCLSGCDECLTRCTKKAISRKNGRIRIDREKCELKGDCADACPTQAIEMVGANMSISQVMEEIEKDRILYDRSEGGITFSGGEPLMQIDFLDALLSECQTRNLHTIVDTSGFAPWEHIERIQDKVDIFFYDLKIMDDKQHKEMTSVSNQTILDNLSRLAKGKNQVKVRIPVVAGVNDSEDCISQLIAYLSSHPRLEEISLLPYHKMGEHKYALLKGPLPRLEAKSPSLGKIKKIKTRLEKSGFSVQVGG